MMSATRNAGVVACVALAAVCVDYLLFKRQQRLGRRLPGPYPLPILGSALDVGLDAHKGLSALYERFGGTYEVVLEGRRVVVVTETDAMNHIMTAQQKIFNVRWPAERIPRWLGYHMRDAGRNSTGIFFNNNVAAWKLHRRVANNVLGTSSVCARSLQEARDRTKRLLETMKAATDEHGHVEALKYTNALTTDLVFNVLLGQEKNMVDGEDQEELEIVQGVFDAWAFVQFTPPLVWSFVPRLYRKHKRAAEVFTQYVKDIAMSVMEEVRASTAEADETPLRKMIRQKFGDSGVFANERIEDIIDDARDFIGAGVDTTGSMTASMLRLLATRPEILGKIRAELEALPPGVEPTLDSCQYTSAVMHEFLRLLPSAPITFRSNNEAVEVGGVMIPAHTNFVLLLGKASRDERYFPEPGAFRPERFLERPELVDYVFTFGAGSRGCPGKKLAKHSMLGFLLGLASSSRRPVPAAVDQGFEVVTGITAKLADQRVRVV